MFRAEGRFMDRPNEDITARVNWSIGLPTGMVNGGAVVVTGPGTFPITARSGGVFATAKLIATYSGSILGPGFPEADAGKLDGSPSGQTSIAYPSDRSIFPSNVGPITVHIQKSGNQDIARIAFIVEGTIDIKYYARCDTAAVNAGAGCFVSLPLEFTTLLVAPSTDRDVQLTARITAASGGAITESNTINVAWANLRLQGGLYYWTTIAKLMPGQPTTAVPGYSTPRDAASGTAVMRYDFDRENPDESRPEIIYTDQGAPFDQDSNPATPPVFGNPGPNGQFIAGQPNGDPGSPPAQGGSDSLSGQSWGEGSCIGCHALSFDGKLLAFAIGGSAPATFAILDLEARALMELDPAAGPADQVNINYLRRFRKANFAAFTTFGPSEIDRLMVNSYHGKLTLHRADTTLAVVRDDLFAAATAELKTDPFWSPDGLHFAFTSYPVRNDPRPTYEYNGDQPTNGQIWLANADPTGPHEDASLLVPRESGMTIHYPAVSHDGALIAFNKSSCPGTATSGYGAAGCDGYDDISATLWLTSPARRPPAALNRANGDVNNGNSWPRWSPDRGNFRGQSLYWLAFSSRRRYGLQINQAGPGAGVPQLWFAAVVIGGEFSSGDVSYSAVWLPNQNIVPASPTGNHVPQWVRFAIAID
jgi:hypothetical protein